VFSHYVYPFQTINYIVSHPKVDSHVINSTLFNRVGILCFIEILVFKVHYDVSSFALLADDYYLANFDFRCLLN
jgi:hypothetical protein